MQELHKLLVLNPDGLVFQDMFFNLDNEKEILAFFLALLELMRLQKVVARQNQLNNSIVIYMVGDFNNDDEG